MVRTLFQWRDLKLAAVGVSGPSAHKKTTLRMTSTKVKFVRSPKTFSLQLISSDYGNCIYSSDELSRLSKSLSFPQKKEVSAVTADLVLSSFSHISLQMTTVDGVSTVFHPSAHPLHILFHLLLSFYPPMLSMSPYKTDN